MITKDQVFVLLLDACPSFRDGYSVSVASQGEELAYVHAGAFADHLLVLHQAGDHREFPAVGAFLERLHTAGDREVRELATIGFLEGVQNVWSRSSFPPEAFLSYLGPVSTACWHALNQFWDGELSWTPAIQTAPSSARESG